MVKHLANTSVKHYYSFRIPKKSLNNSSDSFKKKKKEKDCLATDSNTKSVKCAHI